MKALVLTEKNQPLVLREEPDPIAASGEAIVKVICRRTKPSGPLDQKWSICRY